MNQLDKNGLTEAEFLKAYNPDKYKRPSVTTDIAIFTRLPKDNHLGILMIKRGNHPFLGTYALPGGFVELFENIEDAAARELFEETNLKGIPLIQVGAYGDAHRDPRTHVITILYTAYIESITPKAGDDAADAAIFRITVTQNGNFYELKLTHEDVLLSATLHRPSAPEAKTSVSHCEGIASDHSALILDAYLKMQAIQQRL